MVFICVYEGKLYLCISINNCKTDKGSVSRKSLLPTQNVRLPRRLLVTATSSLQTIRIFRCEASAILSRDNTGTWRASGDTHARTCRTWAGRVVILTRQWHHTLWVCCRPAVLLLVIRYPIGAFVNCRSWTIGWPLDFDCFLTHHPVTFIDHHIQHLRISSMMTGHGQAPLDPPSPNPHSSDGLLDVWKMDTSHLAKLNYHTTWISLKSLKSVTVVCQDYSPCGTQR